MTEKQEQPEQSFHAQSVERVLESLRTSHWGLTVSEAVQRLDTYGPNEVGGRDKNAPLLVFVKQFHSALVYILLVAATISYIVGHEVDTYVILIIVVLNAIIGFFQEYRAERSIAALKKSLVLMAQVFRDGERIEIPARELVPGDIVALEPGMLVPADIRLVESVDLHCNESSLTGESLPVGKSIDIVRADAALADRANMVHMGTTVTKGVARGVVVATGSASTLGSVAQLLEEVPQVQTHFHKTTRVLAMQMASIAGLATLTVFSVGYFVRDIPFIEIFMFAVATLVSGIPEGLPAILSIVLAAGAYRMSKRNALMRTLAASETLGVVTTIVTDKTGTLTQNVMMVETIAYNGAATELSVTGTGWEPTGEFRERDIPIAPLERRALAKLLHIAGKSSTAQVTRQGDSDAYHVLGDPTEGALAVCAHKAGLRDPILFAHERTMSEVPFTSETRIHATLIELREHGEGYDNFREAYVAGAPEDVLARANRHMVDGAVHTLEQSVRKQYEETIEVLSRRGLRVIALAYKTLAPDTVELGEHELSSLVFVGVVGMRDPVRADVPEAIQRAHGAGVRIIMATGDHKATAVTIAKEIGLVPHGVHQADIALTGAELEALSDAEFAKALKHYTVFARLEPKTKLRIAEMLQRSGETVAMTGDGVNDALALKQADIGIAMGRVGTDVARQSADLILTDDNFATIVNAIEEGRTVFINTRQAATFLTSTSFGEHATILTTMFMGLPLPLLPTQILWLNLVTDGVAGVPLALEPSHRDVLKEKPRKPKENILSFEVIPFMVVMVSVMTLGTVSVFVLFLEGGIDKARTGAFAIMSFTQLFNMLNVRSLRESLFTIGVLSNKKTLVAFGISLVLMGFVMYVPMLQRVFSFVSLAWWEVLGIFVLSSCVLWFGEMYKLVRSRLVLKS